MYATVRRGSPGRCDGAQENVLAQSFKREPPTARLNREASTTVVRCARAARIEAETISSLRHSFAEEAALAAERARSPPILQDHRAPALPVGAQAAPHRQLSFRQSVSQVRAQQSKQ